MTTGQQLKTKLGLDQLQNVRISRVLISTYKTYLVFYDTRRPNMPITNFRAFKAPMPSMLYIYPFNNRPTHTPLMDLDDFNGTLNPAMFFTIDLAGYFNDPKKLTKVLDSSPPKFHGNLKEYVTLADLKNTASASGMTKRFRRIRNQDLGPENRDAKLIDCFIDEGEGSVTFAFLTEVTPYPDDPDHTYSETDPEEDFQLVPDRSRTYEMQIKILDFLKWLKTHPDEKEITRDDIKEILDVSNIQVFSNAPSFHWQGMNAMLSQLDGSIHPTDIMPKFWNQDQYHGDNYFLDKHLYGLMRSIDFFEQQMASMLTKKLQDRGLI